MDEHLSKTEIGKDAVQEIVAAGETYAYDPDLSSEQARAVWVEAPPGRSGGGAGKLRSGRAPGAGIDSPMRGRAGGAGSTSCPERAGSSRWVTSASPWAGTSVWCEPG